MWAVFESGEPRDKVDLLLLGDGYTAAEMDKWHADARRLAEILFAVVALQGAARRLQRLGGRHAVGRERRRAPLGRRLPPLAAAREPTTRSAPSATC